MTDCAAAGGELGRSVGQAVRAGVDWVQVRERGLEAAALLELAEEVAAAARSAAEEAGRELRILVNRRADVALAIGADGVHLGYDAMDPESARGLLGSEALVGLSVHAPSEIPEPERASYVHLAPVFAPLSKAPSRPPLGLGAVSEAAARGVPVLAQGGIDPARAAAAVKAGAAGVAVTGAILMAAEPGAAAAGLREALDRASAGRGPGGAPK